MTATPSSADLVERVAAAIVDDAMRPHDQRKGLVHAPGCEKPKIHHHAARTVTEVRAWRKADGWRQRPGGRDICPGCWTAGHR
ncbi:hypothetical protein [Kitasatospora sp. NPDC090091]|uniref:hypothetical protein n=1 Tax=Kitasatospora sp. NPDC090091 TaxID=3364081 RepID=UPI0037FA6239